MSGFFKHIPNIKYDFKSDGKYYQAKDMFRKVSIWSYLQEGVSGYTYYRIPEGTRPDVVAERLYGDGTLYWTFFLVNENLQDFNDWPKSGPLFEKFIARKYSGVCLTADETTDIVSFNHETNVSTKFVLGEKVTQASTGAHGFITYVDPTQNRITLNSVTGTFNTSIVVGTTSAKSFIPNAITNEKDIIRHYEDVNGLLTTVSSSEAVIKLTIGDAIKLASVDGFSLNDKVVLTGTIPSSSLGAATSTSYYINTINTTTNEVTLLTAIGGSLIESSRTVTDITGLKLTLVNKKTISNYRYELDINEEKHIIRYIQPKYMATVLKEFKELIRE